MKLAQHLGLALSLSLALGTTRSALAEIVPAPATKGAFILNEYEVHDAAALKAVTSQAVDLLKAFKGELVLREKLDPIFGGTSANLSVVSFPTIADARAWLASPGYAKFKAERAKTADVRAYLVEKLD